MTQTQQKAYLAGYNHGWYAPTHYGVLDPEYHTDADYKQHYDAGFADGKDHKPPREVF